MPFLYRGDPCLENAPLLYRVLENAIFVWVGDLGNAIFCVVFRVDLLFHEAYKFHVTSDKKADPKQIHMKKPAYIYADTNCHSEAT